jgi:HK97 family phage portal protein
MAAETYATSYLLNGAEPGVVLETDQKLDEKQQKRLVEGWKAAHQGPHKAHLPTVLEGGLKAKPTSATNKDSQLLELRSFQVEDIARIYGVPPHLIGLTEKQTSWGTGVEQMAIGFLQFHLLDWLVMWETAIKRDLLTEPSDTSMFAEHMVDSLLRADFKSRMDGYAIAITNGILSRNEARQKENKPPYTGGEKFLYPSNMAIANAPVVVPGVLAPAAEFPSHRKPFVWKKSARAAERAIRERKAANE